MTRRALFSACMTFLFLLNNSYIAFAEPNPTEGQTIQENKIKYEQLDSETMELDTKISKLNSEINNLNEKLSKNNSEIEDTNNEIKTINYKIEEAKLEIDKTQKTLDGRLRSMYKSNMTTGMLVYLITSENIFDMLNRVQAMSKIVSIDKEMISEINKKKDSLNKNATEIEEKKNELEKLKESIQSDLAEVNSKKEEEENLLESLNSRKDEIMSVIEANEENLISHPLSIINSDSSSISELQNAVNTLQAMLPQLNSDYSIGLAKDAINLGNDKIALANEKSSEAESKPTTSNSVEDVSGQVSTHTMNATAYTGHGLTATGLKPIRDPNGISTVAVDPNVIPLGSKVYVEGYGYAIASDTGGAIKGNKIDLYMNSDAECYAFGRRTVTVNVIAYPGQW
ncbi:3D domain-containing protein [Clostridium sp. MB05]